jgi:hypothetical protein
MHKVLCQPYKEGDLIWSVVLLSLILKPYPVLFVKKYRHDLFCFVLHHFFVHVMLLLLPLLLY